MSFENAQGYLIASLLTTLKNYSKECPEITIQIGAKAMKILTKSVPPVLIT
jgi:hypothetical protein